MDWHGEVEGVKSQPIVLILPGLYFHHSLHWPASIQALHINLCSRLDIVLMVGLTGSSQSEYVKTFVTVAKEEVKSPILQ